MFGRNTRPDPASLTAPELADLWGAHKAAVAEATEVEDTIKAALRARLEDLGFGEIEGDRYRVTLSPATTATKLDDAKVRAYLVETFGKVPKRFTKTTDVKGSLRCTARKRVA